MKKFWIRILACALCLCLCPVSGLAAEDAGAATLGASQTEKAPDTSGLCPHHTAHTAECGYTENTPCAYDCKICKVQALIDALPGAAEVTEANTEAIRAQLEAVLTLFRDLTEEEQAQVDLIRCLALQAILDPANTPVPAAGTITVPLDFTNVGSGAGQTPAVGSGYQWSGDALGGYLLELTDFKMELTEYTDSDVAAIKVPLDGELTLRVSGQNSCDLGPCQSVFWTNDSDGGSALTIQGSDKQSSSLEVISDGSIFMAGQDLHIKDVTIKATTNQAGVISKHGNIILESVDLTIDSQGWAAACIGTDHGDVTIQDSTLNLHTGNDGLFIEGDITVIDSDINISARFNAGIVAGYFLDGNYEPGVTPGRTITFSGNSNISIDAASAAYGICVQGKLLLEDPVSITARGSAAAFGIFEGIELKNMAVTEPMDGVITPPAGNSKIHTVRSGETIAASAKLEPVQLTADVSQTSFPYGGGTEITVTSTPELTASVSIYKGEAQVGSGNLGDPVLVDSTRLGIGSHTLTVKLQQNKGNVFKDVAVTVTGVAPVVTAPNASALQKGQKLSESVLTGGSVINPDINQPIEGTWSWKDGTILPTVENSGYTVVFTPADSTYDIIEWTIPVQVQETQVLVENGLTVIPVGLKPLFESIAAIEDELRTRVTAVLSDVGDQIVFCDMRLQYRENGIWVDVDPNNFPDEGVDVTLAYPEGTNGIEYTFTVQHMISYGTDAGKVETMSYTPLPEGLRCHFTSLSPVAIGWQQKGTETPEPTPPPVTPGRPSAPVSTGSGGGSSSDPVQNDEYDFWQSVRKKIEAAGRGDTVTVNPRGYERMPKSVMDALRQKDGVTLVLLRDGGEEIVIPSEKALDEAMQVYYPLPYLEGIDFGAGEPVLSRVEESGSKPNPGTGGWNPAWGPVKN